VKLDDDDILMVKEVSQVSSSMNSNPSKLKKPQKKNLKFA